MAKQRNPSFEILRVVAMLLIVVWHFLIHGVGNKPLGVAADGTMLFNVCAMELIGCLSKISTNCYVLISGYFLVSSSAKWQKIPKIWLPIFFYSVMICLLFMAFGSRHIPMSRLGEASLPLYFDKYWFATRYVALVAIAPFLSVIAKNITRRQYVVLLSVLFVLNFNLLLGKFLSGNNSMMWFMFLFFVGGYIRMHVSGEGRNNYGKYFFLSAIVLAAFFQMQRIWKYGIDSEPFLLDYHDNNGVQFVTALLLFLWAAKLKVKDSWFVRLMCRIAPLTFGVYLIHDNEFVRSVLWKAIGVKSFRDSWLFVPVIAAGSVAVFTVCIGIDWLRDRLFQLLRANEWIDSVYGKIYEWQKSLQK